MCSNLLKRLHKLDGEIVWALLIIHFLKRSGAKRFKYSSHQEAIGFMQSNHFRSLLSLFYRIFEQTNKQRLSICTLLNKLKKLEGLEHKQLYTLQKLTQWVECIQESISFKEIQQARHTWGDHTNWHSCLDRKVLESTDIYFFEKRLKAALKQIRKIQTLFFGAHMFIDVVEKQSKLELDIDNLFSIIQNSDL